MKSSFTCSIVTHFQTLSHVSTSSHTWPHIITHDHTIWQTVAYGHTWPDTALYTSGVAENICTNIQPDGRWKTNGKCAKLAPHSYEKKPYRTCEKENCRFIQLNFYTAMQKYTKNIFHLKPDITLSLYIIKFWWMLDLKLFSRLNDLNPSMFREGNGPPPTDHRQN